VCDVICNEAVPFRPYCAGVATRTRNVSEYMLVLAVCLVSFSRSTVAIRRPRCWRRRARLRSVDDRAAALGEAVRQVDEEAAEGRRRAAQATRQGALDAAAPALRRLRQGRRRPRARENPTDEDRRTDRQVEKVNTTRFTGVYRTSYTREFSCT